MDLREQKYVCTLAELGNLTRAAERLYISQPALSIYITNLEKNLGTPLFDRSGKKFTLTYAGEQYVKRAEKMLDGRADPSWNLPAARLLFPASGDRGI